MKKKSLGLVKRDIGRLVSNLDPTVFMLTVRLPIASISARRPIHPTIGSRPRDSFGGNVAKV